MNIKNMLLAVITVLSIFAVSEFYVVLKNNVNSINTSSQTNVSCSLSPCTTTSFSWADVIEFGIAFTVAADLVIYDLYLVFRHLQPEPVEQVKQPEIRKKPTKKSKKTINVQN